MDARFDEVARIAQVAPDRVAVDDGRRQLAYADLDRRGNQVGHALIVKCTPVGAVLGWHAPLSVEVVEVALGAARVGVFIQRIDPETEVAALANAYAPLSGLILASELVSVAAPVMHRSDRLHWCFVLEGPEPGGPIDQLPGAAPYEPAVTAYPGDPVQPEAPRLRPDVAPPPDQDVALVEPPPELVLDEAFVARDLWAADLLGSLVFGGRIVVRPGTTSPRPGTASPDLPHLMEG
jgi:hypothetical protein